MQGLTESRAIQGFLALIQTSQDRAGPAPAQLRLLNIWLQLGAKKHPPNSAVGHCLLFAWFIIAADPRECVQGLIYSKRANHRPDGIRAHWNKAAL
ncbi:hypothetical protein NDU88_006118 [Pleurodeles waltl]|uniref:Uncharacterized protein n=1 Tax=Pleurodeles waltl TaxID=8319 RepID=A0AAV7TDW3_PLEWA|nr:hypothetical protein NDU88_006118 [Pleurodeles waltl]